MTPPVPNRLFAVFDEKHIDPKDVTDIDINNFEIYPRRTEIVSTFMSAILGFFITFAAIAVAQFWVRSGKDFHNAVLGLSTSLVLSTLFQVILKILIGGTRPNFLEICQPDLSKANGQGYGGLLYDRSVCTGDKRTIDDALESFPSGHSNAAFAGLLYLTLYLNAKLKVWSRRRAPVWKLLVVMLPLLLAAYLSLTRLLDYTHHWYDILAGAIIGAIFAFAAYRSQYISVFDYATNHIPSSHDDDPITGEPDEVSRPILGKNETSSLLYQGVGGGSNA